MSDSPASSVLAEPVLRMESISKRFGVTQALQDVSFTVRGGEVMALIGENGAGKSTLMKVLSGASRADSGKIDLFGSRFTPRGPHDARRAGVAMIYQELNLAPDLSIEDNVMLGQEQHVHGLLDRRAQRRRICEALELLGHPHLQPETPVRRLSVGARQVVEIARALVFKARVVVFDEPTSSLTQRDAQQLFEIIGRLKSAGLAIVYISHFLEEMRAICDSYTVLRDGRSVGSGRVTDVSESEIISLMVGRAVEELFPQTPHDLGETILSVESLSGLRMPRDVSFELRRGEILGVAGLVGAGRTELLRTILALDPVRQGVVRVLGVASPARISARIRVGLGMVSEDRKLEGLAQSLSIADNMTLSRLGPYSSFGVLDLGARAHAVERWMKRLRVRAPSSDTSVQSLSGGNQQKVALARVMHQQADVLLLDEPTRGVDVGAKSDIYRLIGELAAQGKAILFVSSYLPELMAMCDRVAVMARGRVREIRPTSEWSEDAIMAAATGVAEDDLAE